MTVKVIKIDNKEYIVKNALLELEGSLEEGVDIIYKDKTKFIFGLTTNDDNKVLSEVILETFRK